jgi:hypothetical protein
MGNHAWWNVHAPESRTDDHLTEMSRNESRSPYVSRLASALGSIPDTPPRNVPGQESSAPDGPIRTLCSCIEKVAEDVFRLLVGKILEEP